MVQSLYNIPDVAKYFIQKSSTIYGLKNRIIHVNSTACYESCAHCKICFEELPRALSVWLSHKDFSACAQLYISVRDSPMIRVFSWRLSLLPQKNRRPHHVGSYSPQPAGESRVRHANRRTGGAHPVVRLYVRTRPGHGAFWLLHHS